MNLLTSCIFIYLERWIHIFLCIQRALYTNKVDAKTHLKNWKPCTCSLLKSTQLSKNVLFLFLRLLVVCKSYKQFNIRYFFEGFLYSNISPNFFSSQQKGSPQALSSATTDNIVAFILLKRVSPQQFLDAFNAEPSRNVGTMWHETFGWTPRSCRSECSIHKKNSEWKKIVRMAQKWTKRQNERPPALVCCLL